MNQFSEIVSVLSNSPSLGYAHTIRPEVDRAKGEKGPEFRRHRAVPLRCPR